MMGGAALDVFSSEPLDTESPLRSEDRILLSPHAASSTSEAFQRIGQFAIANLRQALAGQPLDHVQNAASPSPTWND
jgi:phosphoglycerate dehydrogenase-like enzyme